MKINGEESEFFDVKIVCKSCGEEIPSIYSSYVSWPEGGGYSTIYLFCPCKDREEAFESD
jgi:hypothetical protein